MSGRKKIHWASYVLSIAILAALVFGGRAACNRGGAGEDGGAEMDVAAEYRPEYARGFTIERTSRGSSLIRVSSDWGRNDRAETSLFVSRNGEAAPAWFDGDVVEGEIGRIVCLSASYVAMLEALGCCDRIVGVSGAEYISNAAVRRGVADGTVRDIGYDYNTNYEVLAALRPDVVLLYGIDGENRAMTDKLSEMGIKYCYISDYMEQHPLAKAEWIVAVGEICGCGPEAAEYFADVRDKYNALCSNVYGNRPAVIFNTPYKDNWYMPDNESYIVRFVEDAGGRYVYDNTSGRSLPISAEEAFVYASKSDVWLNPGFYDSMSELVAANPKFAGVKPVIGGRVYNCNRRQTESGGSDFWESGVVMPHVVLRDMIWVLHPESAPADYEPYFYKHLE